MFGVAITFSVLTAIGTTLATALVTGLAEVIQEYEQDPGGASSTSA